MIKLMKVTNRDYKMNNTDNNTNSYTDIEVEASQALTAMFQRSMSFHAEGRHS